MLKLKAVRKKGKVLAVVAVVHLVIAGLLPSNHAVRAFASEREHAEHEHEEVGIPGDDEIIEVLHMVERLKETDNPIWSFLITGLLSAMSIHQLLHSLHEARMHRRHLKMELEHEGHNLHNKHQQVHELENLEKKIAEMEKSLTAKESEFKQTIGKLRGAGKNLRGPVAGAFDKAVDALETKAQDAKPPGRAVVTLDKWLDSAEGKRALQDSSVAKWATAYRSQRDAMKQEQIKFFDTLLHTDNIVRGGLPSPYRPDGLGEPGARLNVHDEYGRVTDNVSRPEAINNLSSRAQQCALDYRKLAQKNAVAQSQLKPWNYYTSRMHMDGVKADILITGGLTLAAYASYLYFKHKTGGDAFHNELERRLRFEIDWKAKSDLLTQLASSEGKKEMAPFYDAVYEVINSKKFAGRLRDAASQELQKRKLGDLAAEEYLAKLENKDKVDVATMVDLANTARTVGGMQMTRKQMMAILSTDEHVEPQFRELFIDAFATDLPGMIYPALRGTKVMDEKLKQEIVAELEVKLRGITEKGQFPVDPSKVIAFPGKGKGKGGAHHDAAPTITKAVGHDTHAPAKAKAH